ncbi:hypothetical protein [Phascolarctobacterium sp.]
MSKNERITKILQNITAVDDWRLLAAICGYPNDAQFEESTSFSKAEVLEKTIKDNYKSIVSNMLGECEYCDILMDVAKRLEVHNLFKLFHSEVDYEILEKQVIGKYIERLKLRTIESKGYKAWLQLEKDALINVKKAYERELLSEYEYYEITSPTYDFVDKMMTGRMDGFVMYLLICGLIDFENMLDACRKLRYLEIDVTTIAAPSIFTNPIIDDIRKLKDKNDARWDVAIETVVFLSILALKQKYAETLAEL